MSNPGNSPFPLSKAYWATNLFPAFFAFGSHPVLGGEAQSNPSTPLPHPCDCYRSWNRYRVPPIYHLLLPDFTCRAHTTYPQELSKKLEIVT